MMLSAPPSPPWNHSKVYSKKLNVCDGPKLLVNAVFFSPRMKRKFLGKNKKKRIPKWQKTKAKKDKIKKK
jgi:hypothetical protein